MERDSLPGLKSNFDPDAVLRFSDYFQPGRGTLIKPGSIPAGVALHDRRQRPQPVAGSYLAAVATISDLPAVTTMSSPDPANDDRRNGYQTTFSGQNHFTSIPIDDHEGSAEDPRTRQLKPLTTAADVDRNQHTRVEFDDKICCNLREYARRRAPNRRSIDRHLVGVAGELAVATWLDVPLDTRITDDYEGDRGYDLEVPREDGRNVRVEVKTTRRQEPRGTVKRARIDNADWFVLCRSSRGADRIEIIGYARRAAVKAFGDQYGLSGYQLTPEYLHVTDGTYISPDDVRAAHYRY